MNSNLKKLFPQISFILWLVTASVFLFISGCTFFGVEGAEEDSCVGVTEQKTECQCETIEPEETNTLEVIANTPLPVKPGQNDAYEDITNEIKNSSDSHINGKIVFQWISRNNTYGGYNVKKLMLIDGDNNRIRYIGHFSGTPAISPDGNSVAIGCPLPALESDITEICILDIDLIADSMHQYPEKNYRYPYTEVIIGRLTLPEQCWQYQYDYRESRYEGILSLAWSPGGDRLAMVCGDLWTTEVCILPLEGEAKCWDQAVSVNVSRVAWSPADENTLAVSGGFPPESEIYLVDSNGNNKRFLAAGWSPEWSPDGSKIAYVERKQDITVEVEGVEVINTSNIFEGIAAINPDGTGHELLYQYDQDVPESYIHLDQNGVYDQIEANRLAWSSDGRYLTFTGNDFNLESRLYRLNIETGEVISLTDTIILDHWVTEADWGP